MFMAIQIELYANRKLVKSRANNNFDYTEIALGCIVLETLPLYAN